MNITILHLKFNLIQIILTKISYYYYFFTVFFFFVCLPMINEKIDMNKITEKTNNNEIFGNVYLFI